MEKVTVGMIDGSVHVFSVPSVAEFFTAAEAAVKAGEPLRVPDQAILPADMIVYVRRGKITQNL